MATKVGDLYFESGIKTSGFNRDAARMENRIGQSTKKMKGLGGQMGKGLSSGFSAMGINPMVGGIAAVGAALGAVGKQAYDFSNKLNSAMLEVKTISSSVTEDYEGMKQQIMDVSMLPIKDDAIELSEAFYQIVSAGHDGADGMMVLEAAAKAATGGVTETETAADGLTTVLNAWGLEAERVNEVSDVMFTAVKLGKTTMGELSSSIAQVAPLASSMGISFEEVFAATASLTKQGVPTAQAMTQIRASMLSLNDILGDGWAKTMTYQEALQAVSDKAGGSQTKLKEMMGRVEGVNAVLAMTGDKAGGAAKDLEDMANSTGAANEAFNTMADDTDIKWNQVTNKWKAQLSSVGSQIEELSSGLASFLDAALTTAGTEAYSKESEVDGFIDRMKNARNSGASFTGGLVQGLFGNDEEINERIQEGLKNQEELDKQRKEDLERFHREVEKKTEGLSEIGRFAVIHAEMEKYQKLKEEDEKLLEELEGEKGLSAAKKRLNIKKEMPTYQAYADEMKKLLEDMEKDVTESGGNAVENVGVKTIQALEDRLKELKDKSGTFGSIELEIDNQQAIQEVQTEIDNANQKIQEGLSWRTGSVKIGESKSVEEVKGPTPDESLADVKKLTKEEQERLKAVKERVLLEAKNAEEQEEKEETRKENMEAAAEGLYAQVGILDSLANLGALFNEELAEGATNMADLAYGAAGLMSNLASGNMVGAISSGVGILTSVIGQFVSANEHATMSQKDFNEATREMNELIIERIQTLVDAGMMDFEEGITQQTDKVQDNIDKVMESINNRSYDWYYNMFEDENGELVSRHLTEMMEAVYGKDWGGSELSKMLNDVEGFYEKYFDTPGGEGLSMSPHFSGIMGIGELNESAAKLMEYQEQLEELKETFLGVSKSDLSNSIVDGIMDGLKLAEDGLGEFGDSFQEIMESVARNSLITTFNSDYLNDLVKKFNEAMKSEGKIDSDEMGDLQDDYEAAVRAMKDKAEAWSHVIGENTEEAKDEGMKGDIQGITEKTAGQLEGRISSIQMNVIGLKEIGQSQLQTLEAIRVNTSYNFHLEAMADDMDNMRKTQLSMLETMKSNNDNQGVTI